MKFKYQKKKMFSEGIHPIGDGLLDVDDERLKGLLVQDDINEIYDVEQTPFARGKFAAVRRAIHKKSGVHFAAKFLKRRRRAQSSDKEIKHEIAVLMMCAGADNIVKLNAVHESRSDTALLLELATGGELQTFLDNEECLTEAQTRICMREVLKALQFLHKRSIAHLDLKPQNILLNGERIEDGLKLCDFGISRVVANGSNVREILGTPDYVAPEVLQYEPLSLQTDIWSVGVLTYVLLSGFSPFGGDSKQETFLNISQCALTFPEKLFKGISVHATDFIRRALRIKPNDRMTASGCLEHIWLRDEMSVDRKILNVSKAHDDLSSNNGGGGSGGSGHSDYDEEDDDENSTSSSSSCSGSESSSNNHQGRNGMTNGTNNMHNNATIRNGTNTINGTLSSSHTTSNCSMSKQQQNGFQQQLNHELMPSSRRHSSDANKENTFLRKPSSMSSSGGGGSSSNSSTTTTKSSISSKLNGSSGPAAINPIHQQQLQLTTTNGSVTSPCLFPDAPTTPKVIRKAPTSESSPTSVKALVKKFQLESNCQQQLQQPLAAPNLLLKEAHHNNNNNNSDRKSNGYMSHHHLHHHHQYNTSTSASKYHSSNRKSNGTTTATPPPLKSTMPDAITKGGQSTMMTTTVVTVELSSQATATTSSSSSMQQQQQAMNPSASSSSSSSSSVTTALVNSNNSGNTYKTSCVFCLTCSGPGCRHSGTSVANKTTTNSIALDQGIIC